MSEGYFICLLLVVLLVCIAIILNTVNTFNLVRRCDDFEDELHGVKDDVDLINYEKAYAEEWSDD